MIRARLLIGFVLVALLPVIGVGISTYLVSYQNGRQQSIDRLESVAARKELAIQVWVQSLEQELQVVRRRRASQDAEQFQRRDRLAHVLCRYAGA